MMKEIRPSPAETIPVLLRYRIVTGILLALILRAADAANSLLLSALGRSAVSAGDFKFLFTTWQGVCIIILELAVLFLYTAFDLHVCILVSSDLLRGNRSRMKDIFFRAASGISRLLNINGLGVVLFITLLAPLTGVGLTTSLTSSLTIPNFISSVISETPLYRTLFIAVMTVLAAIAFLHIFTLHGIVLDDMDAAQSRKQSTRLIRASWKNYVRNQIVFSVGTVLTVILITALFGAIPGIYAVIRKSSTAGIYCLILAAVLSGLSASVIPSLYVLEVTRMYEKYTKGLVPVRSGRKHRLEWALCLGMLVMLIPAAEVLDSIASELFSGDISTAVIAHRGGGAEAPENTAAGVETAAKLGACGSEIDIQRTKDGKYVVNHDATFMRTAANGARPEDLTLEEARQLLVDGKEPVASFEDVLDAAKGKIRLFVELKGKSADRQMADDAVRIIKERHMENETVLISLKYDLIDYIETVCPEMETGYLTFFAYGKIQDLHCDYLGLEEGLASYDLMDAVKKTGKKVLVWTPNTEDGQKKYLLSAADAIITDRVSGAMDLIAALNRRTLAERIMDFFLVSLES